MRRLLSLLLLIAASNAQADCVVLLHGLARTARAMDDMADALATLDYQVVNIDYPSREHTIEELAPMAIDEGLSACGANQPVHFVTHSLGGILVRYYLHHYPVPQLGRVVMLAPPNHGSEVVDNMRNVPGFVWYNGPAVLQLGTAPDSIPNQLPAATFPLGIIAGTSTINYMLSRFLPDPDDGKVSVASAQLEGMHDFVTVPYSHPFLMQREEVINLTVRFLRTGSFDTSDPQ